MKLKYAQKPQNVIPMIIKLSSEIESSILFVKGNCSITDVKYGEEDRISPSTLIFHARKG